MSSSIFLKAALVSFLVIGVGVILMFLLPGDASENAPLVGIILMALFLVGLIIYMVFMPGMYQKSLDKKGDKSLRKFIMADPRFRDAMAPRTEKWQGEDQPVEKKNASPKTEESEAASGEPEQSKEEKQKSPDEPPDDDDLFA